LGGAFGDLDQPPRARGIVFWKGERLDGHEDRVPAKDMATEGESEEGDTRKVANKEDPKFLNGCKEPKS